MLFSNTDNALLPLFPFTLWIIPSFSSSTIYQLTVPNDLKLATMDYIKLLFKQTEANQRYSLQGESASQFDLGSAGWPPYIRRILDMYRIPF